jgi:N-hydroxyarylamine O-acetyltransferase
MIQQYLARIGYQGDTPLTRDTLDRLQTLHYETVPYENLDILAGKPLSFGIENLFGKIVTRRRGGYCFELNGLYGWLLGSLGFAVKDHMARFLLREPEIPMRRHRVLTVSLEGRRVLCDVGVGLEVPRKTILLEEGLVQSDGFTNYRIEKDADLGWVLWEEYRGEWIPYYSFTEEPQLPIDYVMPSFYCERHPDSIFNKEPMVAIMTPAGRRTLDGDVFKDHGPGGTTQTIPTSLVEREKLMMDYFGLPLDISR